jgi:hypothetical protein
MKVNKYVLISRKSAIAIGLSRYFTGISCKRGHLAERRTSSSDCVECSKLRQASNKVRLYKHEHYQANKENVLLRAKSNYEQNKTEKIAYSVEYQRKHSKRIYQRDKIKIEQKNKDSPWLVMHLRLRAGLSSSLKAVGVTKKSSRTMVIVGRSHEQFRVHIEKQFLRGMTWENRDMWHIDHIIPISKAKCEQDVISLYHFTNLRPMWAVDNIRKSNKEFFLI